MDAPNRDELEELLTTWFGERSGPTVGVVHSSKYGLLHRQTAVRPTFDLKYFGENECSINVKHWSIQDLLEQGTLIHKRVHVRGEEYMYIRVNLNEFYKEE